MSKYFLWLAEKQSGPFEVDEVREMVRSRQLDVNVLFCREGDKEWLPVKSWPAFFREQPKAEPEVDPAVVAASAQALAAGAREAECRELRKKAESMVAVAWLCVLVSFVLGVCIVIGENTAMLVSLSGGFAGLALWLGLISQLIYIRAELVRR